MKLRVSGLFHVLEDSERELAIGWAGAYGDDLARAIEECPRADWLLAMAVGGGLDRRAITFAACACARLAVEAAGGAATGVLEEVLDFVERAVAETVTEAECHAAGARAANTATLAGIAVAYAAFAVIHPSYAVMTAVQAARAQHQDIAGQEASLRRAADIVRGILVSPPPSPPTGPASAGSSVV